MGRRPRGPAGAPEASSSSKRAPQPHPSNHQLPTDHAQGIALSLGDKITLMQKAAPAPSPAA